MWKVARQSGKIVQKCHTPGTEYAPCRGSRMTEWPESFPLLNVIEDEELGVTLAAAVR